MVNEKSSSCNNNDDDDFVILRAVVPNDYINIIKESLNYQKLFLLIGEFIEM